MADCGWNPKACFLGTGRNGKDSIESLKSEWERLLKFHAEYKKENPDDFYDPIGAPELDLYFLDSKQNSPQIIDASKYDLFFMLHDEDESICSNLSLGRHYTTP